jgi:CRISPR-associated protein Csy1
MLDKAIDAFFAERIESWLKKNMKLTFSETEKQAKLLECNQIFSLENWLPHAAKRAGQMSLATHPCTFSHPSARKNNNGYATPIVANATRASDGYLRSGNVVVETDALGNAAVLDVYKFLMLEMADARKLIDHIQEDSDQAIELLTIQSETYETLKDGFLTIMASNANAISITSSKIKQVYFPVSDDYHQLSILSCSGMIFELKKRIDYIRFSDEFKALREHRRESKFSQNEFFDLYDITTIGFGGTKPQNISVLNNQNGGKAHLLLSVPPMLDKRSIHFPKNNFFIESFRFYEYRDIFDALHKLFKIQYNNIDIRERRDRYLQSLMDRIIEKMWGVRFVCEEQYHPKNTQLKPHQKIWLCDGYKENRKEESDWLDKLCREISSWIILTYEKSWGKQTIKLGEAERAHIYDIVNKDKEALR